MQPAPGRRRQARASQDNENFFLWSPSSTFIRQVKKEGRWEMALRKSWIFSWMRTMALVMAFLALWAPVSQGGDSDLIYAAYYGDLSTVKSLLATGAKVNAKDKNCLTALMAASLAGHREVVKLLLAKGAEVNARTEDGQTALSYAAIKGDPEILEMLLAKGAEINAKDKNGKTALILAARTNHPQVRQLLIEAGAK
jgi:ankyrin repeat protein